MTIRTSFASIRMGTPYRGPTPASSRSPFRPSAVTTGLRRWGGQTTPIMPEALRSPLSRSIATYSGLSPASETTMCAAVSGATGIMPPRPNLVWSATMITRLATSIIFCSEPTTSVLLLLNPASVMPPMPMITASARMAPSICSQNGPQHHAQPRIEIAAGQRQLDVAQRFQSLGNGQRVGDNVQRFRRQLAGHGGHRRAAVENHRLTIFNQARGEPGDAALLVAQAARFRPHSRRRDSAEPAR